MQRLLVLFGLLALGILVAAGMGLAQENGTPEHPHFLILGLELDGEEPVGFRKCVELAAGQSLRLNAHHDHAHTGRAGEALFLNAGNVVVPGSPLTPWNSCEELIADIFPEE